MDLGIIIAAVGLAWTVGWAIFTYLKSRKEKQEKEPEPLEDSAEERPSEIPLEKSNIPHPRNRNFTGRELILTNLRNALSSGEPAALTQVISGLGGIGKTQIALEYAYRHQSDYDVVWWVRTEKPETLAADYAGLAQARNLPEKDAQEQQIIIDTVRRWLGQNKNWLLIFDNAQAPEDIRDYLPKEPIGHILITSRHQGWRGIASPITIKVWPREESVDFLCTRTGQDDKMAADAVAEALGDLPLALAQAGAYIAETSGALGAYLKLYSFRRSDLWDEEHPPLDYPDTVATTWSMAMEQIRKEVPAGADILNLCAYLAPDNIPRNFFGEGNEHLPDTLRDAVATNRGIRTLNSYSLIEAQSDFLSVHRLVQAVVQDNLSDDLQRSWTETAVRIVNSVFPSQGYNDPGCWPLCIALLPHAQAALLHTERFQVIWEKTVNLLNNIAGYFHGRAAYTDAEPLYRRALEIDEAQLGETHPGVATDLNNLAGLLRDQGKYDEAEPLYRRALEIREARLGHEHPSTVTVRDNLDSLLDEM